MFTLCMCIINKSTKKSVNDIDNKKKHYRSHYEKAAIEEITNKVNLHIICIYMQIKKGLLLPSFKHEP